MGSGPWAVILPLWIRRGPRRRCRRAGEPLQVGAVRRGCRPGGRRTVPGRRRGGRGYSWARPAFVAFFCVLTAVPLFGLGKDALPYTWPDVIAATAGYRAARSMNVTGGHVPACASPVTSKP